MTPSPYLFRAADHPLTELAPGLQVREAVSPFGIALRYQERAPDAPGAAEGHWCETGHSIFILSGRIQYRFDGTCCTFLLGRRTGMFLAWLGVRWCGMC